VIVSSDAFNLSRIATVQVALLSSVVKRAAMPGNVVIPSGIGGPAQTSVAMAMQVATIDRADLTGRQGALPRPIMAMIDNALRYALAL
jgi:mRNA interferase MazF